MINRAEDDVIWDLAWTLVGALGGTVLAAVACERWETMLLAPLFGALAGIRAGRLLVFSRWERVRNSGDHLFWIAVYSLLGGLLAHWAALRQLGSLRAQAAAVLAGIALGTELGRLVAFNRWRP